jgi:hypothetical protein
MNNFSMQAGYGRTYRYLQPSIVPLYEFGAGLAYSPILASNVTFKPVEAVRTVAGLKALADACTEKDSLAQPLGSICTKVQPANGRESAAGVILAFAAAARRTAVDPYRQLFDFARVPPLPSQASVEVCVPVCDTDVERVWLDGTRAVEAGTYEISVFDGAHAAQSVSITVSAARVVQRVPTSENRSP